jgi:AraC-like DNA-binding protein
MALSAAWRPAKDEREPAMRILDHDETEQVLARQGLDRPVGAGFAFADRSHDIHYDWHSHGYHQLVHVSAGVIQLETADGRFILAPQAAAFIPAGLRHRTMVADATGVSLYLAPTLVARPGDRLRLLAVTPVLREMMLHARRWPPGTSDHDPLAMSFFATLALMCSEGLAAAPPLWLPRAGHPGLRRAMDYAAANPGAASQAGALAAACLSERTFRRLFVRETGITWQSWLTRARIMAAMAALGRGERVTGAAADAGFASASAFAKTFAHLTGEAPATYRRRVLRGVDANK